MPYCFYCMKPKADSVASCPECGASGIPHTDIHQLTPGTLLGGKYLVGRVLGEGGFGITYIGRDTRLDMRVAIKEYYPNGYSNRNNAVSNRVTLSKSDTTDFFDKGLERFLREARTLAKFCGESGVVGVRDFFEENGTAYIVMDYLDGVTLKEYLRAKGPIPAETLFQLMQPVLEVLDKIHAQDLIHRDISPDNIMLMRNGQLKLLDFGAAREVGGDKSLSVMLKPGYAPEEQYRTRGRQGSWTDVYALCATMYKCITGITPDESLQRVLEDEVKTPSQLGIAISPVQEQALMKGMQVRVADRWQTVKELAAALYAVSDGKTVMHSVEVTALKDEDKGQKTVFQSGAGNGQKADVADKTVVEVKTDKTSVSAVVVEKKDDNKDKNKQKVGQKLDAATKETNRKKFPVWIPIAVAALVVVAVVCVLLFGGSLKETVTTTKGNDGYVLTFLDSTDADPDRLWSFEIPLGLQQEDLVDVHYLGQDLWTARKQSLNSVGLYDGFGRSLIAPEAELIIWPDNRWDNNTPLAEEENYCRYLLVYYADGYTEDAEKAILWKTEQNTYNSPVNEAYMYTGYYKVYDLEEKRFVTGIESSANYRSMQICGENFCIYNGETVQLYNADGDVLLTVQGQLNDVGDGVLLVTVDGTYRVYDENGQKTYASNNYIAVCGRYSPYLVGSAGDQEYLMNIQGNRVMEETFDYFSEVYGDVVMVRQDDKYGLIRLDGSWLAPCQYDYFTYLGNGYFSASTPRYKYTLVGPEGIVATKLENHPGMMQIHEEKVYLVINNREYSLDLSDMHPYCVDIGIMTVKNPVNGMMGVYDLFTGELLLDTVYETVEYVNGCLYAYRDGVWEAYEVSFSTEVN